MNAPPEAWVEAYNDFVAKADGDDPPTSITLPAADLPPSMVRQILKLFEPNEDA